MCTAELDKKSISYLFSAHFSDIDDFYGEKNTEMGENENQIKIKSQKCSSGAIDA